MQRIGDALGVSNQMVARYLEGVVNSVDNPPPRPKGGRPKSPPKPKGEARAQREQALQGRRPQFDRAQIV
jgi:hypothetical protein